MFSSIYIKNLHAVELEGWGNNVVLKREIPRNAMSKIENCPKDGILGMSNSNSPGNFDKIGILFSFGIFLSRFSYN